MTTGLKTRTSVTGGGSGTAGWAICVASSAGPRLPPTLDRTGQNAARQSNALRAGPLTPLTGATTGFFSFLIFDWQ